MKHEKVGLDYLYTVFRVWPHQYENILLSENCDLLCTSLPQGVMEGESLSFLAFNETNFKQYVSS